MPFLKYQAEAIKSRVKFLFGKEAQEQNGLSGSILNVSVNVNREIKNHEIVSLSDLELPFSMKRSGEGIKILFAPEA